MKTGYAAVLMTVSVLATGVGFAKDKAFTESFGADKADMSSIGTNRFFVLSPGYTSVFKGEEDGKPMELTISVLAETRMIEGVETRVVEERETRNGALIEISRNYFAISRRTTDVFYFGEDVDIYKGGKVVEHGGSWHSGESGARFGLFMPGTPLLGARFAQENAPKVAMDRVEIISLAETWEGVAGKFENCLKTEETSAIESGREFKIYAPGVGLVQDAELKLEKSGF